MSKDKITRRDFVKTSTVAGGAAVLLSSTEPSTAQKPRPRPASKIKRDELVARHNPVMRKHDPMSPLSVGNGEFAFTCDVTGLQTFAPEFEKAMPLATMSQWGWHSSPIPAGLDPKGLKLVDFDTPNSDGTVRKVAYHTSQTGQKELYDWLRQNPHRLHLGQIGFQFKNDVKSSDVKDIEQTLDLWRGIITSNFHVDGKAVTVRTAAHPTLDLLAVSVESALISEGDLKVQFKFPYGSPEMHAADWGKAAGHQTTEASRTRSEVSLKRKLDADEYFVTVCWQGNAGFMKQGDHDYALESSRGVTRLNFVVGFAAKAPVKNAPTPTQVFAAAQSHWEKFWSTGGVIDFSNSTDKRAQELERRVVLSQYLTAIQCSGSMPPQETGLTTNSWYGKFHLEMHWWHAAHFPLWNRASMLERSLGWYGTVQQGARERAKFQGYTGARWGKMVGPDGRDSPSPIGPLLIWQQPHPIFYAELMYQTNGDRGTLRKYASMVNETAEWMSSYAHFEAKNNRYVLGPPMIPAQENHPPRETWNATYEIEYWRYGLKTAQAWRERLGLKRVAKWDDIVKKLSKLPVKDGIYLAHENCPQTYTERNIDHPSMLGAYGLLNGETVDKETMRRTLKKVMDVWKWEDTWGWDYPMTAMTAAKLGEGKIAVDVLLLDTPKNGYLPNGHNYQRPNLPLYLPGNGGLLYAIAMMVGGWQGSPLANAPGFPSDGSWIIRYEGLNTKLLQTI